MKHCRPEGKELLYDKPPRLLLRIGCGYCMPEVKAEADIQLPHYSIDLGRG